MPRFYGRPTTPDKGMIRRPSTTIIIEESDMTEAGPIRPKGRAEWRADKVGKTTLFRSDRLMLGLDAFEPGQQHAAHAHSGADKAYLVVEGRGRFTIGDETFEMAPGDLLVAPAGVPHGVVNDSGARLLVLVTMAPAP